MSRSRAFTVLEVVVVVAILVVLAALLAPVFAQAKESGKMAVCRSNLRQRFLALQQYRDEVGGTDEPAESGAMGFPAHLDCVIWPDDCWTNSERRLNCSGQNPSTRGGIVSYRQFWAPPRFFKEAYYEISERTWIDYVRQAGAGAIVLLDANHPLHVPSNTWTTSRAFGIAIDGSLKTRVRRGNPQFYSW